MSRKFVVVGSLGVVALASLCACSSSAHPAASASASPSPSSSTGRFGGGGERPAADGLIAAISGTTMQVQSAQSGQIAVSWTSSTRFTDAMSEPVSAIKVGDCVSAVATTSGAAAATVTVTAPVNGACTAGRGGFGGGFGGRMPGMRPSGSAPSGVPSGAAPSGGARRFAGNFVAGKVTTISASVLTVAPAAGAQSGSSAARTISIAATTKVLDEQSVTSSALKTGECVSAQGSTSGTGAVAATRVAISAAVNGSCSTGFGNRRGSGAPGAGTPS